MKVWVVELKKRIKYLIGLDRVPTVQPVPEPVQQKVIEAAIEDITNGKVLKVKEVAARLRCSEDMALKEVKKEMGAGAFQVGSDYRIPESTFLRIVQRMMCLQ